MYVCLFTCASTRAVHLELTCALNVDNFLLAFRWIVGRRRLPVTLISDNAKTFRSSSKEIQFDESENLLEIYCCQSSMVGRILGAYGANSETLLEEVYRSSHLTF